MDKTLGQIAHEAHQKISPFVCPWDKLAPSARAAINAAASAVAAAVKEEDAKFIDAVGKDWEEACVEEKVWAAEYLSAAIRASIKEGK